MLRIAEHKVILLLHKRGNSIRQISRLTGYSRNTVRKVLKEPDPALLLATRSTPSNDKNFLREHCDDIHVSAVSLFRELQSMGYDGSLSKLRTFLIQSSKRKLNLTQDDKRFQSHRKQQKNKEQLNCCQMWVYRLIQGELSCEELEEQLSGVLGSNTVRQLYFYILEEPLRHRNKAITILAYCNHITQRLIAKSLFISRNSVRQYVRRFELGGVEKLFAPTQRGIKKYEDPEYVDKLFMVLHAPPSSYGINRTTWRIKDLCQIMGENGLSISKEGIHRILKAAGYRILKAKRVLTSNDPNYKEKVEKITEILSNLKPNEKFFSIDEFGPLAIKMQGGRSWVPPGQTKTIPQWQKSKGSMLITGALELSTNQITHFYSSKKNTDEMIKLLDILLDQYKDENCIYLSWDAASWHISKKLYERVEEVNSRYQKSEHMGPIIRLAPLPSCAQFLNVIESVFSGMARAVLHNSDYASINDCTKAIDRHFANRNRYFKDNPKRAGNKIWGEEITMPIFCPSNNCKDPRYR